MLIRGLSRLLYLANCSPPYCYRSDFYAMKDRILRRFGRRAGEDWQEIVRECWGCHGTGVNRYYYGDHDQCWKCDGTGVYDQFWVRLERWEFAGHIFHRPAERVYERPEVPVAIKGKVTHADHGYASKEAALWLALMFDRRLFVRLMMAECCGGRTWRYPLTTAQKAAFRVAILRHSFALPCEECGSYGNAPGWMRLWPRHTLPVSRCEFCQEDFDASR